MWNIRTDYCEINGKEWDYVAETHGLKQFMSDGLVSAIYGQFEVVGSVVEYRQYVGTLDDIKILQKMTGRKDVGSSNSEMLDDIEWLKNGHCEIVK